MPERCRCPRIDPYETDPSGRAGLLLQSMTADEKLWQLSEKPDAIFGSYREITTGMLYALEERGVSVPRDVAVIAMNNDPAPIHPTLDVSCIDSGIVPICAEVMRLLDETVRVSPPPKPRIVSVPSVFHIGKTT